MCWFCEPAEWFAACEPPEWFTTVTPLEVQQLRADLTAAQHRIAQLSDELDFERRHNDYLTDTFVLKNQGRVRPERSARERCARFLLELLAGPGRG